MRCYDCKYATDLYSRAGNCTHSKRHWEIDIDTLIDPSNFTFSWECQPRNCPLAPKSPSCHDECEVCADYAKRCALCIHWKRRAKNGFCHKLELQMFGRDTCKYFQPAKQNLKERNE